MVGNLSFTKLRKLGRLGRSGRLGNTTLRVFAVLALITVPLANSGCLPSTGGRAILGNFERAPDASQVEVTASSDVVVAGESIEITIIAKDQYGDVLTSGSGMFSFSTEGGTSTGVFGPIQDLGNGVYKTIFSGKRAGTRTSFKVIVNGVAVTTGLPTIMVTPGEPSSKGTVISVASPTVYPGSFTTVTVTLNDEDGNPTHESGHTIILSNTGGTSTGTFSSVTDNGDGTYTANFTAGDLGTPTFIHATVNGLPVPDPVPSITVVPGPPSAAHSVVTSAQGSLASGNTMSVTLTTKDAEGHSMVTGGATVTFSLSGGGSTATVGPVTDNRNGTYSATLTGIQAGTASTIQANIDGSPVTTTRPTLTVIPGPPSAVTSTLAVSTPSVVSGSFVTLILTTRDLNGNFVSTGGATVTFSHLGGTSTGTAGSTTDHGNGTYSTSFTGVLAGTATTLRATLNGVGLTSTLPTLTVVPGALSLSQSLITVSAPTVGAGSTVSLNLTAKDGAGNLLTDGNLTVNFTRSGGTSAGTIGAVSYQSGGVYTASFTGSTVGSATTISATINGNNVLSSHPTLQVVPGAPSVATSVLTVGNSSVTSSSNTLLTLAAKDALGNTISTGGLTVVFSQTGGTSTGTISATTDNNNGTYTATFTGVIAGTPTTIRASIGGTQVTSSSPTITVTPGSASASKSLLSVSASTVTSGSSLTLTLITKDANNNTIPTGGSTVIFSRSGGTSTGIISSTTDLADGSYTATFSGLIAGTPTTIGAAINGIAVTTPLPTIRVLPGALSLAQSQLTVSSPSLAAGSTSLITLTLKDSSGNQLLAAGGSGRTVAFSNSGGTSTGTISSVTDNNNGTYSATFTGIISGTATTLRATVDGSLVTSTSPTLTVTPGPASPSLSFLTVSSDTLASGSVSTLTLTTRDANGNQISTGGLPVLFSYNNGTSTGTMGATVDNADGTYTATFTGVVAGTATTIRATIGGSFVTSTSPTITVVPGNNTLSQSQVTVSLSTIASGSTSAVTLTARDANGNQLTSGGLTVAFSHAGGLSTGTFSPVTDHGNGTYTSTFTGILSGTATTIRATIDGQLLTSTLPAITVTPGPLSLSGSSLTVSSPSIASEANDILTLTTRDANGNQLTSGGLNVEFSNTGGTSTGIIGPTLDNNNGTYTAAFTGVSSGSATTIQATIGGSFVTSTLPTITVTPGPSAALTLVTASANTVASGSSVTITLITKDTNGDPVTTGGATVVFSRSGGTSIGLFGPVIDHGDGTYTSAFTGATAGTATTISATISGKLVTSTMPTVTVIPGPASPSLSLVSVSGNTVTSGSTQTLTLTTKDQSGNQISSGGLAVVFSHTGGTSTGTIGSTTDHGNGTYTALFTGVTAGTATTITATIGGSAVTSTLPTIVVTPGPLSLSQTLITVSASTVSSGLSSTLTLTAKDANGNQLPSGGLTVVFSRSGGTSAGSISGASDNNNGTYTASFSGTTAGTATSITATVDGSAITSTPPTITVIPGMISSSQSFVTVSASTVASSSTITLTLTSKDANGNLITTGAGGAIVVFSHSGGISTGTIGSTTNVGNGTYTATFTGVTAGTATTISATINGSAVITTLPTVTVIPGTVSLSQSSVSVSAASIASNSTSTLTLIARDAHANALPSGGLTVVFSRFGGSSTGTVSPTTDNANGTYTATFTGILAGTATTIQATVGGSAVTSTPPTITVTPGAASISQSILTTAVGTLASGSTTTLTLIAKDSNSNPLTTGGLTVTFGRSGGISTGTISSVTDNANGTYTATFVGALAGSATTITGTIGGAVVTSTLPTITVTPGPFSLSQSLVTSSLSTVVSGSNATLTLSAKDASGNQLTSGGLAVVFGQSGGTSSGTIGSVTDNNNGTYTANFDAVIAGSPTTITATINGSAVTSTLPTITVSPGAASVSKSIVTVSVSTLRFNNISNLNLIAKDANGNSLTSGGLTVVFSGSGGTSTGTVSATTDNANGTYSATFTGVQPGTATTIGATIDGSAVTGILPTITVFGVNLEVPIEMIDSGIASATSVGTFETSKTNLNTTDYDGTSGPIYSLEVVASNTDSSSKSITIIDSAGTSKGTLTVPAGTSITRLRGTFTPTAGTNSYRLQLPATTSAGQLSVFTARILVQQTNATKTKLYIPLFSNTYDTASTTNPNPVNTQTSNTYSQTNPLNFPIWKKDTSKLATLAASNPWQFDAIIWSGTSGKACYASLYNTAGTQVTASEVSNSTLTPVLASIAFADSATNFTNLSSFTVYTHTTTTRNCYIAKAGLWVTLTSLSKGESYYRVDKQYSALAASVVSPYSRILLDLSLFNNANVAAYYEATGYASAGASLAVQAVDHGAADSGTASTSEITGCSLNETSLGTTIGVNRSAACSGITDGDRIIHQFNRTAGTVSIADSKVVVSFQ